LGVSIDFSGLFFFACSKNLSRCVALVFMSVVCTIITCANKVMDWTEAICCDICKNLLNWLKSNICLFILSKLSQKVGMFLESQLLSRMNVGKRELTWALATWDWVPALWSFHPLDSHFLVERQHC
jgi:hypothetical protein